MESNGLSPTLIMPKNRKKSVVDIFIPDNLSNDTQSFVYGTPGNLFNNDDPLNMSNIPGEEKKSNRRKKI